MNKRTKYSETKNFDINDGADPDYIHLKAIASSYGNIDSYGDVIARGAFQESIDAVNNGTLVIKMFYGHDSNKAIGVVDKIYDEGDNLIIESKLLRKSEHLKDIIELYKMKAISDVSIGFNSFEGSYDEDADDGKGVYTITKGKLLEVSLVAIPANSQAKIISMKNQNIKNKDSDANIVDADQAEQVRTKRDFEKLLKDTGCFTNKALVTLASRFKESQSDFDKDQSDSAEIIEKLNNLIKSTNKCQIKQ